MSRARSAPFVYWNSDRTHVKRGEFVDAVDQFPVLFSIPLIPRSHPDRHWKKCSTCLARLFTGIPDARRHGVLPPAALAHPLHIDGVRVCPGAATPHTSYRPTPDRHVRVNSSLQYSNA